MVFELVWVLYVIGIILFWGIGVIGLALASSARSRNVKTLVIIFSVLSIAIGIYFSTRWNAEKTEIQKIAIQLEETIKKSISQPRK
jgi:sensor histidine kinase YesM